MTTLTPTYDSGASTKRLPGIAVPFDRRVDDDDLAARFADLGANMPFVADLLSAVLAHERCGRHLYRSVEQRTANPLLRARYAEFGEETEHHAELLEEAITLLGGDPQYVSPMARAVEGTDSKLLESTFLLAGSVDVMTAEMVMLDAVLLAESIDHANWTAVAAVAAELADGETTDRLREIVTEVLDDEEDHLTWAQGMRLRMVTLQATGRPLAKAAATVEEMVATVRGWFA
jgi:bacterioferritin (cytochrome b1)